MQFNNGRTYDRHFSNVQLSKLAGADTGGGDFVLVAPPGPSQGVF